MALYDQLTADFINKIAGDGSVIQVPDDEPIPAMPERQSDSSKILKMMRVAKNPKKAIRNLVVAKALGIEKLSSMGVLALYYFLNDHYKRDWWDWEPETIWQTLDHDGITVDEDIKDMVLAFQLCVNSMAPFEHWHIFEKVGHAFNNNHVDFTVIQPLEPDEVAMAIKVLRSIQPETEFDQEVLRYMAACCKQAGLVYMPQDMFLKECQEYLDEITFEHGLRDGTIKAWAQKVRQSDPRVQVQMERLDEIHDYISKES